MKYIGMLLMAAAAVGGGFYASANLRDRLEILQTFRQMVYRLKGQMLYTNATLPEALREVGLREVDLRKGGLREIGLREDNWRKVGLREAGLQKAGLQGADLQEADSRNVGPQKRDLREYHGKKRQMTGPGALFIQAAATMEREPELAFPDIWAAAVGQFAETAPVTRRDMEHLLAFGNSLGYADRGMQERTIAFFLEQTDDSIAVLKRDMETKTKLYQSLGIAAGMLILVILV